MGRKKTPCWIGLCIPSVFVILPRTKNPLSWVTLPLPPLLLKGMLSGVCYRWHITCAEAWSGPSLTWSQVPRLLFHPQICEGHQLSSQINYLLSKPCPSSKARFKSIFICDVVILFPQLECLHSEVLNLLLNCCRSSSIYGLAQDLELKDLVWVLTLPLTRSDLGQRQSPPL